MALANRYVVLFFTNGPVPSAEALMDARQYGPHVLFRNKVFCRPGEGFEPCTAVAGDVPEHYAQKFPAAVSYNEWLDGMLPTAEAAPTPGELALSLTAAPLAARILDPDKPRPKRGPRAAPAAGTEPLSGMLGVDPSDAPPPPPPPAAGRTTTGDVFLPPPPPPPEE